MYAKKEDAMYYAIAPVLDVPGDFDINDFDAEAIFEQAFTFDEKINAYRQTVHGADFWTIVHQCAR